MPGIKVDGMDVLAVKNVRSAYCPLFSNQIWATPCKLLWKQCSLSIFGSWTAGFGRDLACAPCLTSKEQ